MSEIRFSCSGCGATLKVGNPALVGRKLKCPRCDTGNVIPPFPTGQPAATRVHAHSTGSTAAASRLAPVEEKRSKSASAKKRGHAKTASPKQGRYILLISAAALISAALGVGSAALLGFFDAKPAEKPAVNLNATAPPAPAAPQPPPPGPQPEPKVTPKPVPKDIELPVRDEAEEARLAAEREQRRQAAAAIEQPIIAALAKQTAAVPKAHEEIAVLAQGLDKAMRLVFSPNGKLLASAHADGTVKIWKLSTATLKHDLPGHAQTDGWVVFSPDGNSLAAIGKDQTIKLWDVESGELKQSIPANDSPRRTLAFSSDGRFLFTGPRGLERWETNSGKAVPYRSVAKSSGSADYGAGRFAIRTDGRVLAAQANTKVELCDPETGQHYRQSFSARSVENLAFSPDGWTLLVVDRQEKGRASGQFCNLESGVQTPFQVEGDVIRDCAFAPEGKCLALACASGTRPGTLQLWDIAANQQQHAIEGDFHALAFSPGGTMLAAADDRGIRVWAVAELHSAAPPTRLLDELKKVAFLERQGKTYYAMVKPDATDAAIAQLAKLPGLTTLALNTGNLTEKGFARLRDFKDLHRLALGHSENLTDDWLASLKNLTGLIELNLINCPGVTDAGLAHLANLTTLESLDLRKTAVTGAGLAHLQKMTRLRILDLGECNMVVQGQAGQALASLAGLTKLTELNLNSTGITEADLASLKGMTAMEHLDLSLNGAFKGAGLVHLKGMAHLQELHLAETAITDAGLENLKGLTKLSLLDLARTSAADTGISDAGLAHLKGMVEMKVLNLTGNLGIKGPGLVHLKGMTNLQDLHLAQTSIADVGLENLKELTRLIILDLGGRPIKDSGAAHLAGLVRLNFLNLTGSGLTDAGLAHLKRMTALQHLGLGGNPAVKGPGLVQLKGMVNLTELYLPHTNVSDAGLENLKGLNRLVGLDLSETAVTDAGLAHLAKLTELGVLNLGGSKGVKGPGLKNLQGLAKLKALILTGTSINDGALIQLKPLTQLEVLWLFQTNITDAGLVDLYELTALKQLGLPKSTQKGVAALKKVLPATQITVE